VEIGRENKNVSPKVKKLHGNLPLIVLFYRLIEAWPPNPGQESMYQTETVNLAAKNHSVFLKSMNDIIIPCSSWQSRHVSYFWLLCVKTTRKSIKIKSGIHLTIPANLMIYVTHKLTSNARKTTCTRLPPNIVYVTTSVHWIHLLRSSILAWHGA
jgi:hypothetical protein